MMIWWYEYHYELHNSLHSVVAEKIDTLWKVIFPVSVPPSPRWSQKSRANYNTKTVGWFFPPAENVYQDENCRIWNEDEQLDN